MTPSLPHSAGYGRPSALPHLLPFPDLPQVYYCLLARLPLTVVFPSVTYEVSFQSVVSEGQHELVAHDAKTGTLRTLSPVYHGREVRELAVFKAGFPVRRASIAEVVLRWLE